MRVGLVVNRAEDYVLRVAAGMSEVLAAAAGSVLVLVLPPSAALAQPWVARLVREGTVDALAVTAVVDPTTGASCVADLLAQIGRLDRVGRLPVVTLGGGHHAVPDVSCDNAAGAALAARHLLADGRRRPLVVGGIVDNSDSRTREQAFVAACARLGLPGGAVRTVRADFSRELAYRRTTALLQRLDAGGEDQVDAVFAANDEMALGAMDALRVHGLRVPEDVAVVGFDDTEAAATSPTGLSSLDQHLLEQGRCAARLLLGRLGGRPVPNRVRTRARLVVRASSAPAGTGTPPVEDAALLRAAHAGLAGGRELLGLAHGLLGATSERGLAAELAALLPRTDVRRAYVGRTSHGTVRLLHAQDGRDGVLVDRQPYRPEQLLPAGHRAALGTGTLVVHLLTDGEEETGVLVHDVAPGDRWTGQALQQGLSAALASLARTDALTEHAVGLERLVAARTAELEEANARLRAALLVDGLTGLQNRTSFDAALARAWEEHRATGRPVSMLMCDVDRFKLYNDVAGHLAGDACLRAVAGCLSEAVRGGHDAVSRVGGEEFAVLLPGTDVQGARAVADRVLDRLRAAGLPHPGGGDGATVSLSIGYAGSALPGPLADALALVGEADRALYRAKAGGRDRAEGPRPPARRSSKGR
ncbi:diguanylate cyclase domain-containing protein [Aquipuribacter hungaricus]|uniref:Diguanylate cyclase domain-containing protein n=2 Tax=Aquipuribacter hungaricus TaxID=545624 RepID=A0ABV7WLU5_9MICO